MKFCLRCQDLCAIDPPQKKSNNKFSCFGYSPICFKGRQIDWERENSHPLTLATGLLIAESASNRHFLNFTQRGEGFTAEERFGQGFKAISAECKMWVGLPTSIIHHFQRTTSDIWGSRRASIRTSRIKCAMYLMHTTHEPQPNHTILPPPPKPCTAHNWIDPDPRHHL